MKKPRPVPADNPAFTESQSALPAVLGLPIEEIRRWRDAFLKKGADWDRLSSGVAWTAGAAHRLFAAYALGWGDLPCGPKNAPERPPTAARGLLQWRPEQVLVAWQTVRNPKILLAHLPGVRPQTTRDLVRVLVPDSARWRRGLPVPARHVRGDLWKYDRSVKVV